VGSGRVQDLHDAVRREEAVGDAWLWIDRLEDRTAAPLDLEVLRGGEDFAAEIVAVADEISASEADVAALIDEVSRPVAERLRGYAPSLAPGQVLELARDRCLDALLGSGGETR
jgi:hypothetical protein